MGMQFSIIAFKRATIWALYTLRQKEKTGQFSSQDVCPSAVKIYPTKLDLPPSLGHRRND